MTSRVPRADERVAVAVPTKNRPQYLAALLAALSQQTYPRWMLVVNDQGDTPVGEHDVIHDLLTLIRHEHEVVLIRNKSGWDRHQRAMEAVPRDIEWILRIDDDVLPSVAFLENVLRPWSLLPAKNLAAVGGCYPEAKYHPLDLDLQLADPSWTPRFDAPTWKLQGFHYDTEPQIREVESLFGPAICYRREAIEAVGGWAVEGYSNHAHREESDACARLLLAGYGMAVTTEAVARHLIAPSGGARDISKTDQGNFVISEPGPLAADELLFRMRLTKFKAKYPFARRELKRYRISDLERGRLRPRRWISVRGRLLSVLEMNLLRPIRRVVRYMRAS